MSFNSSIDLRFVAGANNQFLLVKSSVNQRLTSSVAQVAGSCLEKVTTRLAQSDPSLFVKAHIIEATLKPILEGAASFYLMELKIDGEVIPASTSQPLKIKLNEQFVKTLSGIKEKSTPSKAFNPPHGPLNISPPSSSPNLKDDGVFVKRSLETKDHFTQSHQPVKTRSIWRIIWDALCRCFKKKTTTSPSGSLSGKNLTQDVTSMDNIRPLRNLRNDCFVNAIFQVIMHDKVLLKALLETFKDDSLKEDKEFVTKAEAFKKAVAAYQSNTKPISIAALRHFINQWGSQEDASDLLLNIINHMDPLKHSQCYTTCRTTYICTLKNPSDEAQGAPQTCTISASSPEFLIPLQLIETESEDIPLDGQFLIDNLQKAHPHDGEDMRINHFVYEPKKTFTSIDEDTTRLAFQLKRFTKNGKIENRVDMPENLQVNGHTYQLKAIVVHAGKSRNNGHYYSLIRKESGWFQCNDDNITPIKDQEQLALEKNKGYLYFYERVV